MSTRKTSSSKESIPPKRIDILTDAEIEELRRGARESLEFARVWLALDPIWAEKIKEVCAEQPVLIAPAGTKCGPTNMYPGPPGGH